MIKMRIISSTKKASSVKKTLKSISDELNRKMKKIPGSIAKLKTDINVGASGAKTRIIVAIDEEEICNKRIIWSNKGGSNEEEALRYAEEEINPKIERISGKIADFHTEFVSPPIPKRTYVTIIAGINEKTPKETTGLNTEERRARIKEILNLLGNKPEAINISKTAETFQVSRDIIYRDLEKLGIKR